MNQQTQDKAPEQTGMASLQSILMQSLQDVRSGKMTASNASSVNALAQTLINSAKVEIDFLRATKRTKSQFFEPPVQNTQERLTKNGGGMVATHWQGLTHTTLDD